jgi:heme-degrading monooxygenase HmoA
MFSVLFEVHPRKEQYEAYLDNAKMLRPELEKIDGFVENIRYGSLTRDGWILSLSSWRDEKSLVRWRTMVKHYEVQEKGRNEILLDYHLRVGQYTADTKLPPACELAEQRLDETETGDATTIVLTTAKKPDSLGNDATADAIARFLGLDERAKGYVEHDVYDAVLTPGERHTPIELFCDLPRRCPRRRATSRSAPRRRPQSSTHRARGTDRRPQRWAPRSGRPQHATVIASTHAPLIRRGRPRCWRDRPAESSAEPRR